MNVKHSRMSELSILAEEGGLPEATLEDLLDAAKDILADPDLETAYWTEWAKRVMTILGSAHTPTSMPHWSGRGSMRTL